MINSNEAMLVLNKLPNIQILNGRSTKEEDTEEEDDEEEATGSNNNNHLYVGMEQIEEVKNLESNSNYLSDNNNVINNINSTPTNKGKEDLENMTQSSHKNNINDNVDEDVNEEENNNLTENEKEEENKEKKTESIKEFSIKNEQSSHKIDFNSKCYIDISKIELSSLALPTPSLNSSFEHLLSSFSSILSVNKSQSQSINYQSLHYQELSQIEANKSQYENYMYALYLINSKFKIIKTVLNDSLPLITSKIPELTTNDIYSNLLNELFTSCDVAVNLITYLNPKIKEFSSSYDSLQSKLTLLSKQINDDKSILEKKISQLDSENRLMTDRIFKKASNIIQNNNTTTIETNTIMNTITNNNITPPLLTSNISTPPYNNTVSNNRRISKPTSSTYRSPNKVVNNVITLQTLKDIINEIYKSKSQYDAKCIEAKMSKETMEQHMYTYLNKKYGLKNLIIEWARNIITGIKLYSKEDSSVLLFGKIMRNEQEEDARFAIEKINESISDLLLYYIKSKNPLKSLDEVNKMLKNKKNGELLEEEWKGIIYYIYEIEEAKEIEVKIEQFINRKFNEKKYEFSNKTTMNTIGNNNRKTTISNTVSNTNTISNYYNGNNTISSVKKLSREERYNMVSNLKINNCIQYKEFIKIVLDYHIRLRDKQLKTFVNLFRKIDKDKNGVLNEEEFTELVRSFRIYNEDDIDSIVFKFLTVIDPYENQKITFSECVSLFSLEMFNEGGQNVSLLEKVCFGKTTLSVDSRTISTSKEKEINTINTNSDNRVGDS